MLPEVIRGDDCRFLFQFDVGALEQTYSAIFTAQHRDGYQITVIGVIDGDTVIVNLTQNQTTIVGPYRADLELTAFDGSIHTPYLGAEYGALTIVDDVTKVRPY